MSCEHFLVVSSCIYIIKYKRKEGYVGGSSLEIRAEASAAVLIREHPGHPGQEMREGDDRETPGGLPL